MNIKRCLRFRPERYQAPDIPDFVLAAIATDFIVFFPTGCLSNTTLWMETKALFIHRIMHNRGP